ncbi:MAG TPA: LPS export ABC transporter periplasmic protein LptC [Saprospiraceae bacterium]
MSLRQIVYLVLGLVIFHSCVVDQADLSKYMQSKVANVEEARNIDVVYTDSSYTVFILKSPLSRRIFTKQSVKEEFPEGIEVTFYDRTNEPRSWLTSDYALRDQANRKITVQKNVVLRNDKGERMDGPELIWDEKSKEIYTDRFVRITRADGSVVYSYGFKSNERFTRYELNAVSGDMNIAVLDSEAKDTLNKPTPPSPQARPTIDDRKQKLQKN